MAVSCTECGITVEDLAAHRMSCGQPTHAAEAVNEEAWFLHAPGGRRFGPLTIDEMRAYFTSGMVRARDRVAGPGTNGPSPAAEVAALLQVRAPVDTAPPSGLPPASTAPDAPSPAIRPTPAPPSSRASPADAGATGLGWRGALLWMTMLFAVQMSSLPAGVLGPAHSLRTFVAAVLLRYLGIAVACALVVVAMHRLVRSKGTFVKDALLAMTLVHAVLLGNRFLRPAPAPAAPTPALAETVGGERISVIRALGLGVDNATSPPTAPPPVAPAEPERRDWFGQGRAMGDRGDWAAVRKHATEWTIAEPDEPAAWSMLGLAHEKMGEPHQAIKVYRHALELDPTSHITWDNLGGAYGGLGRHQDAVNAHSKALQIDPRFASAWNNLGIVHARTGQASAAIEAFGKAVELDPAFVKAWNNLGLHYLRLDRPADAIATYRKALERDPGNADATRGLNDAIERERRMAR